MTSPQSTCPLCKKPSQLETQPFCSKRCKDIDLHRWFSGTYAIPGKDGEVPEEDLPAQREET